MELGAALMGILTAVVVKGAVIAWSVWLLLRLGRAVAHPDTPRAWLQVSRKDLTTARILWWSTAVFLLGELLCGAQMYITQGASVSLSVAHGLISAAGMGVFGYGVYRLFHERVLHLGEAGCAARKLCRGCSVDSASACRLIAVMWAVLCVLVLMALLPLSIPAKRMWADPSLYVLPFDTLNAWYDETVVPWLVAHVEGYNPKGATFYIHRAAFVAEYHVVPLASLLPLALAAVSLGRRRVTAAGLWLATALGVLAYAYLEIIVYAATGDAILGSLAHEVVELWYLVTLGLILRVVFRPRSPKPAPDTGPRADPAVNAPAKPKGEGHD